MTKGMWRVAAGVFVLGLLLDFVLYDILLRDPLARDMDVRRPWSGMWPKIVLGEALFAIVFSWIYYRGIEALPALGQGMRFGFAFALLAVAAGLQLAPMIPTTETIIIGATAGNAVKVLLQGMAAGVLAGSAGPT
jgi:hypothetical protein